MQKPSNNECFDMINFKTNEEQIDFIKNSTNDFDWLKFYNSGLDISGLIVITPTQKLIIYPVYRHAYAVDKLYKILYGISLEDGSQYNNEVNNVMIRLVAGESVQVQTFLPKTINSYQKTELDSLFSNLISIKDYIKFQSTYDQVIFEETFSDSINKINNALISDNLQEQIRCDQIDFSNSKKKH